MSHAELILLALLTEKSSHAYGLVQRIRSMEVERWAAVAESTLYSVLRRMDDRGHVESDSGPGERGKPRTVYTLTPRGRSRLTKLVAEGLESPEPMHSDLLVAAVFASAAGEGSRIESAVARTREGRNAMSSTRARDDTSAYGRVILNFYTALADAHLKALRSLRELSGEEEETLVPDLTRDDGSA